MRTRRGAAVGVLAVSSLLVLAGGCDEIWQSDSVGDPRVVAAGGAERLRIFAPMGEPYSLGTIQPARVERMLHEGDALGHDDARLRCLEIRVIGVGGIVDEMELDASALPTTRLLRIDVDRGQQVPLLITSREAGSMVLRTTLFSRRCSEVTDQQIARTQRILDFGVVGAAPLEEEPPPPEEDAGFTFLFRPFRGRS